MDKNRSRFLSLLIYAGLGLAASVAQADTPPSHAWQLNEELSDEFNDAALNTKSKWIAQNPYFAGRKPGLIQAGNLELDDGVLNIWARAGVPPDTEPGYTYTTGLLTSRHFAHYGYYEVRAKPARAAVDHAFGLYLWMDKTGIEEIDVFEIAPGARGHENIIHTNTHFYAGPPEQESDENRLSDPWAWTTDFDPSEEFHVYGLEWDELALRFYVDNRLIREKSNTHWHKPMPLFIATEIMSTWLGAPAAQTLPAALQVDYIRAWSKR